MSNATLVPDNGYSNITQYRSDSTSNYHTLQVYLNKRKSNVFFTGLNKIQTIDRGAFADYRGVLGGGGLGRRWGLRGRSVPVDSCGF